MGLRWCNPTKFTPRSRSDKDANSTLQRGNSRKFNVFRSPSQSPGKAGGSAPEKDALAMGLGPWPLTAYVQQRLAVRRGERGLRSQVQKAEAK